MVAQRPHYISIGPLYIVILVEAFLATGEENVTRITIAAVLCRKVCRQNVVFISWTFRIPANDEDQYNYVYKILS